MTKEERYIALIPNIHSLLSGETDEIARMANTAAMLHEDSFRQGSVRDGLE